MTEKVYILFENGEPVLVFETKDGAHLEAQCRVEANGGGDYYVQSAALVRK